MKLEDKVRGISVCHSGEPSVVSLPAGEGNSFFGNEMLEFPQSIIASWVVIYGIPWNMV